MTKSKTTRGIGAVASRDAFHLRRSRPAAHREQIEHAEKIESEIEVARRLIFPCRSRYAGRIRAWIDRRHQNHDRHCRRPCGLRAAKGLSQRPVKTGERREQPASTAIAEIAAPSPAPRLETKKIVPRAQALSSAVFQFQSSRAASDLGTDRRAPPARSHAALYLIAALTSGVAMGCGDGIEPVETSPIRSSNLIS